jgi:hypothetical protein
MLRLIPIQILLFVCFAFSQGSGIVEKTDTIGPGIKTPAQIKDTVALILQTKDPEYSQAQLQEKLVGFKRMHSIGKNMLSVGIPTTLIGAGLYIGGLVTIMNNNNSSGGGILAILGCVGIGIGPELWVAGAVLNKIGKNKEAEYEQKLKLSLGINSIKLSLDF